MREPRGTTMIDEAGAGAVDEEPVEMPMRKADSPGNVRQPQCGIRRVLADEIDGRARLVLRRRRGLDGRSLGATTSGERSYEAKKRVARVRMGARSHEITERIVV